MEPTATRPTVTDTTADDGVDILLVEDNPGDARLVEEALAGAELDCGLHVVTTGEQALTFLFEAPSKPSPDLVLLDLNLPGMDGCAVLESIRDDPGLRPTPVIMLTSSAAPEDVRRCYEATANAYVTKPTHPDELVSLMRAIDQFWVQQAVFP